MPKGRTARTGAPAGTSPSGPELSPHLREVAARLQEIWSAGAAAEPVPLQYRIVRGGTELRLDLATRQGRFELLLLAILTAAKVKEATAVCTLLTLREAGLTEYGRLLGAGEAERTAILAVLAREYRALVSKVQKMEALLAAARRLEARYGGDPALVRQPGEDWRATVGALQGFAHLKSRAYWICREFARCGVWPNLDRRACASIDTSVKIALWRLGFVGRDATQLKDVAIAECVAAVDNYFAGDTLPLFYQGDQACRLGRSACQATCRVVAGCQAAPSAPYVAAEALNTEQPFALSTGPCG